MTQLKTLLSRYGWAIWRRRWHAIGLAWVICMIGWIGISRIPDQYESLARVYMNTDQTLSSLLHGIAVEDNVAARLDRMQHTLLSATNMKQLIRLTELNEQVKDPTELEQMVAHLQKNISIKLQTRNLFTVSYRDPDPVLAQSVVSNLLTIFMESSAGDSRTDITSAQRFVQSQLERLEIAMRAAEKRKSDFQTKYYDLLPTAGSAVSMLEQSRNNVQQLSDDLSDAIAQSASLQKQIALIPAYDAAPTTDSLPGHDEGLSLTPRTRLAQLNTQFEAARATMKPDHPVIMALQHQIDAVTAQIASGKGAGRTTTQQSLNPLYRDMKMKLVEQETKIASLQRRLASAGEARDKLEQEAKAAPGVDAEFANINRDYDVVKRNYEELLNRRESARIAEDADKKGDKVDIRTIDAPEVSMVPSAPNRPLYDSLVLVAGIAAGIGAAFLLAELDSSFGSTSALEVYGLPVLGSISLDETFTQRKMPWFFSMKAFSAACVALFVAYGGLMMAVAVHQEKGI